MEANSTEGKVARAKVAEKVAAKLRTKEAVTLRGSTVRRLFRSEDYGVSMRNSLRQRVERILGEGVEVVPTFNKRNKLVSLTVKRRASIPA